MTFHEHGAEGRSVVEGGRTAYFNDPSMVYEMLCSERIVVVKNTVVVGGEVQSNVYILANEPNV